MLDLNGQSVLLGRERLSFSDGVRVWHAEGIRFSPVYFQLKVHKWKVI